MKNDDSHRCDMGKLITKKEIVEANAKHFSELEVPCDAIITPLAQDAAKQYGIEIVKSGGPSRACDVRSLQGGAVDEAAIEKIARMAISDLGDKADLETVIRIVEKVVRKM